MELRLQVLHHLSSPDDVLTYALLNRTYYKTISRLHDYQQVYSLVQRTDPPWAHVGAPGRDILAPMPSFTRFVIELPLECRQWVFTAHPKPQKWRFPILSSRHRSQMRDDVEYAAKFRGDAEICVRWVDGFGLDEEKMIVALNRSRQKEGFVNNLRNGVPASYIFLLRVLLKGLTVQDMTLRYVE